MGRVLTLAPPAGVYHPAYAIRFWRDGNPATPVTGVDLRSVVAISTSKSITDLTGTFQITLKDKTARRRIREMDTGRIRLRGHYSDAYTTVLKVVVDEVRPGGNADAYASSADTVITGRCLGKYLMSSSLFLPVWDPSVDLPTVLTFGMGDPTNKAGGNSPYAINRYLIRKYLFGRGAGVGMSAIPASEHWIDYKTRFSRKLGLDLPYLQFNEEDLATAFKRLEILGFTEAWIDELGRQVYRQPQWDAPISYDLPTSGLSDWSFPRGDVGVSTYLEVIPAGDPGIDTATAQALRAGRAPVPSAYLQAARKAGAATQLGQSIDPEFVIDSDRNGKVTAKGRRNPWWQLQHRLGLRPQQITSPLIFTQQQAQAQAEGLLRFSSRMVKGITCTIPGCPELRLGHSIRVHGSIEGESIDRTGYLEQISHDYVEGDHYLTTFTATHGRDKGDPKWGRMVLPRFDPADLAGGTSGTLDPTAGTVGTTTDGNASEAVKAYLKTAPTPKQVIDHLVLPVARAAGLKTPSGTELTAANNTAANGVHTHGGSGSDHAGPPTQKWAADMSDGITTPAEDLVAAALASDFGIVWNGSGLVSNTVTVAGTTWRFQLIYRYSDPQAGDHFNHVHFGARVGVA